jgi:hypothetical protein
VGCLVVGLGLHLGVLSVLLVVWVAVGLPVGAHLLRRAEGAWFREFRSEEEYRARYPVREHAPEALRLDGLARQAGISLAVTPEDLKGDSSVKAEFKEVWDFLGTLRKNDKDGGVRVPPGVVRATQTRSGVLEAMEDVLLAGPDVDWKTPSGDELTVSWIGLRNVQSLLLVRSLLADQRGALSVRDRALEASWRLNEGLWRRTDAAERLLAFVFDSDRNACLRRYRSLEGVWGERLSGTRPLLALEETYQAEGLAFCRRAGHLVGIREIDYLTTGKLPPVGPRGWLFRVATAPYLRLSVAGFSDALREETRRLGEIDPCSLEREPYTEWVKASLPAWNILARVAMPGLVGSWVSGRDAGLDDELTAAVLEARRLGGLRGERRRESAVCPELVWVTRAAGGGAVRVEAEGEPPAGDANARPRLSYTLAPS